MFTVSNILKSYMSLNQNNWVRILWVAFTESKALLTRYSGVRVNSKSSNRFKYRIYIHVKSQ
jgi:hypothetical protein